MTGTIEVGGLTFEVRRSPRRRTIGLTVDRGGELVVHAPEALAARELREWIQSKLLWVHRKLATKETLVVRHKPPEYVSGESFSYLGRRYRLRLVREQFLPLRFDGRFFWLKAEHRSRAEEHFRRWYIRTGREWLRERVAVLSRKTRTEAQGVAVRDLGYRWGSCGRKGILYFNWRLLQLPVRLIDYVIVHELIHLRHPHHRPEFWLAVERAMPDWTGRRDALRAVGGGELG